MKTLFLYLIAAVVIIAGDRDTTKEAQQSITFSWNESIEKMIESLERTCQQLEEKLFVEESQILSIERQKQQFFLWQLQCMQDFWGQIEIPSTSEKQRIMQQAKQLQKQAYDVMSRDNAVARSYLLQCLHLLQNAAVKPPKQKSATASSYRSQKQQQENNAIEENLSLSQIFDLLIKLEEEDRCFN